MSRLLSFDEVTKIIQERAELNDGVRNWWEYSSLFDLERKRFDLNRKTDSNDSQTRHYDFGNETALAV